MGVEYLTDFANTLDIFFTGLSECGVLTKYSLQLQAALVDLDLMLKFKNLIWQLIKSLQLLLAKIPTNQTAISCVEVGTQTSFSETEEVSCIKAEPTTEFVVTCHPIRLTSITPSLTPVNEVITGDRISPYSLESLEEEKHIDNQECIQREGTTISKDTLLQDTSSAKQYKPVLVSEDKCKELGESEASSVMHIVVEATEPPSTITDDEVSEGDVELTCEECDRQFRSSVSLERHLQSHTGFCNMCNQVFNCVQTLQDHCRTVHEGAGCFMCTTCGKRFMTKFSYTRHLESHRGKKGAMCHVCGKSFSRADYLQTHYTIHVGKRSFACSQCPKKFVRRIQLTSHEKTHSGIKDHVCKMCNRGFARSDKLREHMLRHLNIKRYQCATCKRFYAEKRDLKTHLKVHMKV